MKRQRNMDQIKKQVKTPEKGLNEMKISNISHAEFKTLVIRIFKELSEDLNSIKKIQSETKDALIEIKNNSQGINSPVNKAENQISDLEHKKAKNNQSKQQEEKRIQKDKNSIRSLWDKFRHSNIHIIGVQKEKRKS